MHLVEPGLVYRLLDHIGGCAAVACDSCISMERAGVKSDLCPLNINDLNKVSYN